MSKRKPPHPNPPTTEQPVARAYTVPQVVRNRDRRLEKAKRLREQGQTEEANRELEQANRWENELRKVTAVTN